MVIYGMRFWNQWEFKLKINFTLSGIFNGIALAWVFPATLETLFSVKFWFVLALLAAAVTAAEYRGAERAKKGEL